MALWTPAEITTALWLDAADASTITESSGSVSSWADKSGNDRHATQGTALHQPEYDSVNKRVVFDKANSEFMDLASQPFTGTTARTVVAVVNSVAYGSIGNGFFSASNSSSNPAGRLWDLCIESNGFYIRIAGNDHFTPAVTNNTDALIVAQWESGSSSNSSVWHDGSALSRSGGVSQTINTLSGTARIGRTERQPNEYFDGYTYELIVVTGTLTTDDRHKLEGYLAHKWGLAASLPAEHPYKDSAPMMLALFDGTITDKDGNPAERRITVLDATGYCVATDTSDPVTGAYSIAVPAESPYTLVFDGEPDRNAQVFANVIPGEPPA